MIGDRKVALRRTRRLVILTATNVQIPVTAPNLRADPTGILTLAAAARTPQHQCAGHPSLVLAIGADLGGGEKPDWARRLAGHAPGRLAPIQQSRASSILLDDSATLTLKSMSWRCRCCQRERCPACRRWSAIGESLARRAAACRARMAKRRKQWVPINVRVQRLRAQDLMRQRRGRL